MLGTVLGTEDPVAKYWKSLPSWYVCSKYIIRICSQLGGKCHGEKESRKGGWGVLGGVAGSHGEGDIQRET